MLNNSRLAKSDQESGLTGSIILSKVPEIIPDPNRDPRVVHVAGTPEVEEQPER